MQKGKLTWYKKGFDEALASLPSDPPQWPGHGSYQNYRAGYADGEQYLQLIAEQEKEG